MKFSSVFISAVITGLVSATSAFLTTLTDEVQNVPATTIPEVAAVGIAGVLLGAALSFLGQHFGSK